MHIPDTEQQHAHRGRTKMYWLEYSMPTALGGQQQERSRSICHGREGSQSSRVFRCCCECMACEPTCTGTQREIGS